MKDLNEGDLDQKQVNGSEGPIKNASLDLI